MRTWNRAPVDMLCGRCSALIRRGEPRLVLTFGGPGPRKTRCRLCADEREPFDLPPLRVYEERPPSVTAAARVKVFDWKSAAAGEDRE